jgi:hypothetical protein
VPEGSGLYDPDRMIGHLYFLLSRKEDERARWEEGLIIALTASLQRTSDADFVYSIQQNRLENPILF